MDIIIPTLGKERKKTYSPFLPICPETGVVLEIPVIEIIKEKSKIIFQMETDSQPERYEANPTSTPDGRTQQNPDGENTRVNLKDPYS
mgnify:CR=1 FL=1